MNTMVRRLKYRQLQEDPRVSLLFEDGLKWVAMRGTVELDADFDRALESIRAWRGATRRPGALRRPGARHHPHARREGHPP